MPRRRRANLSSLHSRLMLSRASGVCLGVQYSTLYDAAPWGITEEVAVNPGVRRELDRGIESTQELRRRGVRVLPGDDYEFAWNSIGINARDLEHFVKFVGFTPMEAIVSLAKSGGEIMMMGHELGRIREGCLADILLVAGDPLADISILQDANALACVMQDGALHKDPAAYEAVAQVVAE